MQKKENQKFKDEIEEFKQILEAKEQDDEEVINIHEFQQEDVNL